MRLPAPQIAALIVAVLAGAVLAAAEAAQHWGGVVPCALCLLERWPWRAVVVLGLIGMVVPHRVANWMLGLCIVVLLVSVGLGALHVGVEQGAWKSPLPECAAPQISGTTLAERLASMPAHPSKPCDAPTYLVPAVPVSMAAMNLIASLVLAGLVGAYLARGERSRR